MSDDGLEYDFTIDESVASLTNMHYSPYMVASPTDIFNDALKHLRYLCENDGYTVVGDYTFALHLTDQGEHAGEPGWITGPHYHWYTIGTHVVTRESQPN